MNVGVISGVLKEKPTAKTSVKGTTWTSFTLSPGKGLPIYFTAFGKTAEKLDKRGEAGDFVIITYTLERTSFTEKGGGVKYETKLYAKDVSFSPAKTKEEKDDAASEKEFDRGSVVSSEPSTVYPIPW